METIALHLFKDSFGPIITLLNEHEVSYQVSESRSLVQAGTSGVIELIQNAALWGALATIIVAFIKGRTSRKVIITLKDNTIVQAEGMSQKELEKVLVLAKHLTAIETSREEKETY